MFKKTTALIVLFYGLLLISLGYLGYHQAGSRPSLIMGVGFGLLIILSSAFLFAKNKLGVYLSIFATLLLTITFIIRYGASGKTLPGTLALLSGGMLIFLLTQMAHWRKKG